MPSPPRRHRSRSCPRSLHSHASPRRHWQAVAPSVWSRHMPTPCYSEHAPQNASTPRRCASHWPPRTTAGARAPVVTPPPATSPSRHRYCTVLCRAAGHPPRCRTELWLGPVVVPLQQAGAATCPQLTSHALDPLHALLLLLARLNCRRRSASPPRRCCCWPASQLPPPHRWPAWLLALLPLCSRPPCRAAGPPAPSCRMELPMQRQAPAAGLHAGLCVLADSTGCASPPFM